MNKTLFLVNKELLRKVTCYAPLTSKITKCPPACDDALPPEAIGSEKLVLYTDWVQHMLRNLAGSSCRCCAIKTLITIQANYNRNLWTPRAVLLCPRTKDYHRKYLKIVLMPYCETFKLESFLSFRTHKLFFLSTFVTQSASTNGKRNLNK